MLRSNSMLFVCIRLHESEIIFWNNIKKSKKYEYFLISKKEETKPVKQELFQVVYFLISCDVIVFFFILFQAI